MPLPQSGVDFRGIDKIWISVGDINGYELQVLFKTRFNMSTNQAWYKLETALNLTTQRKEGMK